MPIDTMTLLGVARAVANGHVAHVVGLGADVEVLGVAADAVVAVVEHEQALGDGAVVDLPSQAVSPYNASALGADAQLAIAGPIAIPGELDAAVRHRHELGVETVRDG